MTEQTYIITIEEPSGAIISEKDVQSEFGPMDALRKYAAEQGWKPERDTLDHSQNMEYWTMVEADGTRIVVEEAS